MLLENKIVLTPDALLKQDRKGHVGEPIEIETFEDNELDIVTTDLSGKGKAIKVR